MVVAAVDGVVGALEEPVLAVLDDLERGLAGGGGEAGEALARDDDGGGDVVLHLDFLRGVEVFAQAEGAPGAVGAEADAQEVRFEFAGLQAQLVGGAAVDDVHLEVLAPFVAPLGLVEAFEDENEFLDVRRDGGEPGVVLVGEIGRGREEFDDGAEGAARAEDGARIGAAFLGLAETLRVVAREEGFDGVEVSLDVGDEDGAAEDGVGDGFGDLGFAAA